MSIDDDVADDACACIPSVCVVVRRACRAFTSSSPYAHTSERAAQAAYGKRLARRSLRPQRFPTALRADVRAPTTTPSCCCGSNARVSLPSLVAYDGRPKHTSRETVRASSYRVCACVCVRSASTETRANHSVVSRQRRRRSEHTVKNCRNINRPYHTRSQRWKHAKNGYHHLHTYHSTAYTTHKRSRCDYIDTRENNNINVRSARPTNELHA